MERHTKLNTEFDTKLSLKAKPIIKFKLELILKNQSLKRGQKGPLKGYPLQTDRSNNRHEY